MPKKYRKMMKKNIQNDAKMDAKINDFWYLFEKGEKPRNYLKTNRILGFRHAKRYQKSIQNQCKNDAAKKHANYIENGSKLEPKWPKAEAKMHPKFEKLSKGEAKGRQGDAKGEGRKGVEKQVLKSVQEPPGTRVGGRFTGP